MTYLPSQEFMITSPCELTFHKNTFSSSTENQRIRVKSRIFGWHKVLKLCFSQDAFVSSQSFGHPNPEQMYTLSNKSLVQKNRLMCPWCSVLTSFCCYWQGQWSAQIITLYHLFWLVLSYSAVFTIDKRLVRNRYYGWLFFITYAFLSPKLVCHSWKVPSQSSPQYLVSSITGIHLFIQLALTKHPL